MRRIFLVLLMLVIGIIGVAMPVTAEPINHDEIHKYTEMGRNNPGNVFYLLQEIQKVMIGDKLRRGNWGIIKGPLIKAAIIAHSHPELSNEAIEEMIVRSESKLTIFFSAKGYTANVKVELFQEGFIVEQLDARFSRIKSKKRTNKEFNYLFSKLDMSGKVVIMVWVNRVREVVRVIDLSQIK